MAIRTYDDVTQTESYDDARLGAGDALPRDLRGELLAYRQEGHWDAQALKAGAFNAEGVWVLHLPAHGRAGVCGGGPSAWTDADDAHDALERYFGVGGKEMCE
jgi:hypothetical protein